MKVPPGIGSMAKFSSVAITTPKASRWPLRDKAGGPPVKVSDDLFAILARSKAIAGAARRRAFDPTVAPVVRLLLRARRDRKLPDPVLIKDALARVGSSKQQERPSGSNPA